MSAPSFKLRLPPASLFKFPPDPNPPALPPPINARTFASPFPINAKLYNDVLDWRVPVTVGTVYMTSAILMNKYNRGRKNVPFAFTKTAAFHYFVIAHNVFLAVFSALTFFGMIRALAHTWPGRRDLPFFGKLWPGLRTQNGLAGAADALCKLHGPRDLGDAVFYNPTKENWQATNRNIKLAITRTPDSSDVGRLWNEGLAFWGWFFYLSKFYEVLDTFIILAKGKRSSTLQTYHHTGAMACMWAGIRFMSPPIWMFCFLNSGIHTLMYTYYTLAALRFRVPQRIKRTLTTMQISQFLIGITFASLHLFVYYSVPVATPFTKSVGQAVSVGASAVSAAASRAPELAAAAAPSIGAFVKKVLLRAAGEEGMAQRVSDSDILLEQTPKTHKYDNPHQNQNRSATTWRTQYAYVPCIDTTGQAFAIWLNVFYLAPLTLLFTRFFIRSYTRRGQAKVQPSKPTARITQAAEDAAKGTNQKVDEVGKSAEDGVSELADNLKDKVNEKSGSKNSGSKQTKDNSSEKVTSDSGKSDKTNSRDDVPATNRKDDFSQSPDRSVTSPAGDTTQTKQAETAQTEQSRYTDLNDESSITEKATDLKNKVEEDVAKTSQKVGEQASKAVDDAKSLAGGAKLKVEESMSSSKFSDLGSFSMVDHKDLDSSTIGKKEDEQRPEDPQSFVHKIEDHEAPTFAEVANSSQTTTNGKDDTSKAENDWASAGNESSSTDAEAADPDEPTSGSSGSPVKPDLQARSNSSRSQESQRSSSPSKKSGSAKSKIPQPKSRPTNSSPVKKMLSPAKVTTSMAAHSGTALDIKDDSPIGNA